MSKAYGGVLTLAQARILAAYIKTGRIAHLYPRKRTISLNGFPGLPIKDAIARMAQTLQEAEQ